MAADLDAYWVKPGEDMDAFVARTDGLGVAASLRRAAWVTGKPLGEIVAWWNGLVNAHGEDDA